MSLKRPELANCCLACSPVISRIRIMLGYVAWISNISRGFVSFLNSDDDFVQLFLLCLAYIYKRFGLLLTKSQTGKT